jgi:hypothetical protein
MQPLDFGKEARRLGALRIIGKCTLGQGKDILRAHLLDRVDFGRLFGTACNQHAEQDRSRDASPSLADRHDARLFVCLLGG